MTTKPIDRAMTAELDQVMTVYREKLKSVAALWTLASQLGVVEGGAGRGAQHVVARLDHVVDDYMDVEIRVETARQNVANLGLVLDVSRQAVESRTQHLCQEERQKDEEQKVKFREFQQIHRLQGEKAAIERDLVPARVRLAEVMDTLQEKSEKMRNLERFHGLLAAQCCEDMARLHEDTEAARCSKASWDLQSVDVRAQLAAMCVGAQELKHLESTVWGLSRDLHNQRSWHEEELQSKLFLSSRSKEIKHRLSYFRNILQRLENPETQEEGRDTARMYPESDAGFNDGGNLSEQFLVDGSPGVQARQVEQYLSAAVGSRVLTDYTMLQRLKDEVGVPGLAYLVEAVRLQGPAQSQHRCMEERRVQQALRDIALEYRDRDDPKGRDPRPSRQVDPVIIEVTDRGEVNEGQLIPQTRPPSTFHCDALITSPMIYGQPSAGEVGRPMINGQPSAGEMGRQMIYGQPSAGEVGRPMIYGQPSAGEVGRPMIYGQPLVQTPGGTPDPRDSAESVSSVSHSSRETGSIAPSTTSSIMRKSSFSRMKKLFKR